jgi:hypothetical protein
MGLWPLVAMPSFLAVAGPKTDLWLVRTLGLLVVVIALVLLRAARSGKVSDDVALLGAASALAFACLDVVFVSTRDVPSVYLLDAIPEILLVAGWGLAARRERAAQAG